MSNSKTWAREFAEGFDEMVEAQEATIAQTRSDYIMDEGVNKGHTIHEIARALGEYSSHAPSQSTIQRWIDIAGISVGLGDPPDAFGGSPKIGSPALSAAIAASGVKMPDEDDEYVQHYIAEGATPDVAKRIARGERVGEWLRDNDGWNMEKQRINPSLQPVRSGAMALRSWLTRWTTWMGRTGDFVMFLQSTKQDQMGDSTVHKQLYRFAAQLEKQAERFEIGYEKSQARKKAKKN